MSEENPISPISAAEPPKTDPLAKPASAHAATLKLNPVIRKPTIGGATQTGLKPGLKLPPKPGIPTAGLKLPPKPGATISGLKPGIRLPPKPGHASMGMKLPTQTALKPAARPSVEQSQAAESVPAAAAPKPMEALKAITQNLKSITAPIPQRAILHKTGIIADPGLSDSQKQAAKLKTSRISLSETAVPAADQGLTDAQKQAAKSKTSRISLSDAMGVAPVSNDAPMKTIRIKRPADLIGATTSAPAPVAPSESPAPAAPAAAQPGPSITQRKTLKISRPGGVVRPAGKFGVKKSAAPTAASAPSAASEDVADIPDIPNLPPVAPVAAPAGEAAVTGAFAIVSLITQVAACGVIGALAYFLYKDSVTLWF